MKTKKIYKSNLIFTKNKNSIKVYTKNLKKLGEIIPIKKSYDWKQRNDVSISFSVLGEIHRTIFLLITEDKRNQKYNSKNNKMTGDFNNGN